MARKGRRPGTSETRQAILSAARAAFAARGYGGVTIRGIAGAACVDPALVHHYFATKDRLFLAALQDAVEPGRVLAALLGGDPETLGVRLVDRFLALWEGGAGANAAALLRTAVAGEPVARLVRAVVFPAVARELVDRLGVSPAEAPMRTSLIASQMSGLVTTRYVLRLEPIASATAGWVSEVVGPTIQRYMTGPLPPSGTAGPAGGQD